MQKEDMNEWDALGGRWGLILLGSQRTMQNVLLEEVWVCVL